MVDPRFDLKRSRHDTGFGIVSGMTFMMLSVSADGAAGSAASFGSAESFESGSVMSWSFGSAGLPTSLGLLVIIFFLIEPAYRPPAGIAVKPIRRDRRGGRFPFLPRIPGQPPSRWQRLRGGGPR